MLTIVIPVTKAKTAVAGAKIFPTLIHIAAVVLVIIARVLLVLVADVLIVS